MWTCPRCKTTIHLPSKEEKGRGWCSGCEVKSWTKDKRDNIQKIVMAALREDKGLIEEEIAKFHKRSSSLAM